MIGHNLRNAGAAFAVVALSLGALALTILIDAAAGGVLVAALALLVYLVNLSVNWKVGRSGRYNPFETPSMFFYITGLMCVVVLGYSISLTLAS